MPVTITIRRKQIRRVLPSENDELPAEDRGVTGSNSAAARREAPSRRLSSTLTTDLAWRSRFARTLPSFALVRLWGKRASTRLSANGQRISLVILSDHPFDK